MRRVFSMVFVIFVNMIIYGCASAPPNLPSTYFENQREMSINVVKINDKANFRDSGQGGIIGAVMSISRSSNMQEMFEGIKGETVKELLRQEIEKKLESTFAIDEESKDLGLEIEVSQWGWFLPTTAFGIKTGSYQLDLVGSVSVYDLRSEKKKVAQVKITSQKPLGNDPTALACQQALKQAIEDFAEQARISLLKEKKT